MKLKTLYEDPNADAFTFNLIKAYLEENGVETEIWEGDPNLYVYTPRTRARAPDGCLTSGMTFDTSLDGIVKTLVMVEIEDEEELIIDLVRWSEFEEGSPDTVDLHDPGSLPEILRRVRKLLNET